ncbi:hypothetical protein WJX74_005317 [Apatococcus lobatus]|uniref:GATA-type domain-containing protein n=1 Tax=Apatococcus lobatus TaxID=904363 RepID=A0AAW1QUH3_9CHLO
MDLQHPPDDLLDACSPWLSLPGPEADWLETCPSTSGPLSPGHLDAAAETSDLSADTQERCLWTLAVVDSQTGKALRPVTPAEAQAVWVPQPVAPTSNLLRGDSQPDPIPSSEAQPEQVTSEEGSSPPSPTLPTRGLFDSLERQTSVASQLSKIGGPCQHCGVKESPQWRRGPVGKPILCNACGTRYRRTHQFKHASELMADGLPRSCSISSSLGASAAINSSLESPGASLGTRSASISTRSGSFGPKAGGFAMGSPAQHGKKKLSQGAASTRNCRKRTLGSLAQDDDTDIREAVAGSE